MGSTTATGGAPHGVEHLCGWNTCVGRAPDQVHPWPLEQWLVWQQVLSCLSLPPCFSPWALTPVPVLMRCHPADHGPEGKLDLGLPPSKHRVRHGCSVPTRPVWTHWAAWVSLPPALRRGGRGRAGAAARHGPHCRAPATHGSQIKGSQSNLSSSEGKQISN